jgi:hypothetical protein
MGNDSDRGDRNTRLHSPGKDAWQALVTHVISSEITLFLKALGIMLISSAPEKSNFYYSI